jgi:hypothetical protein
MPSLVPTFYLKCLFWTQHDFSAHDISRKQHEDFIANLKKVWEFNHIEVPLPRTL